MQETDVVRALAALAQEVRLRVFRALVVAGPAGLTPGDLAAQLEVAPNTLSFHLKELSHAGLIQGTQEGKFVFYRVNFSQMNALLAFLAEHCCQGSGTDCEVSIPACTTSPTAA